MNREGSSVSRTPSAANEALRDVTHSFNEPQRTWSSDACAPTPTQPVNSGSGDAASAAITPEEQQRRALAQTSEASLVSRSRSSVATARTSFNAFSDAPAMPN
eukprot:CAMPEP_0174862262 /NCGR_PEP_ID=MMETSP1114-20130205/53657_1 /TAXON_ID=312471 /ORGANISM="Neobodo designis, Strain CCAP 1951/1" /LENGTH=102 /DNA_ID=CAMNT_0016097305 /DNA_START=55 /DNA_END=363 /DNA_ORIENTATION=+